jgi:hypothetical protein
MFTFIIVIGTVGLIACYIFFQMIKACIKKGNCEDNNKLKGKMSE